MKTAILTVSIGRKESDIFVKNNKESFIRYAEKTNSDFLCFNEIPKDLPINNSIKLYRNIEIYTSKIYYISKALEEYDRIIYVDDTCYINKNCPNLFDIIDYNKLGAFNEGILNFCEYAYSESKKAINKVFKRNDLKKEDYINSGVLVISKDMFSIDDLEKYVKSGIFNQPYPDQSYINYRILNKELTLQNLDYTFNRYYLTDNNYTTMTREDTFNINEDIDVNSLKTYNFANIYHLVSRHTNEQRNKITKIFKEHI